MQNTVIVKNSIVGMEFLLCAIALVTIFLHSFSPFTFKKAAVNDVIVFVEPDQTEEAAEEEEVLSKVEAVPENDAGAVAVPEPGIRDLKEIEKMKRDWRIMLINRDHFLPTDYESDLKSLSASVRVDERIADDLKDMIKAAADDGITLQIVSGYRSYDRQTALFQRKMKRYMSQGMSYSQAHSEVTKVLSVPGSSEHQAGLAVDIVSSNYRSLTEGFADTEAGKWLAKNCADYGFILRYPKDKEEVTGIIFEPWHFRYVGKEYAGEIMGEGITLEEYLQEKGVY
ncbi:MAG: M15 family metallopeptidase [Lachnospiraceae bacterium]|nr:M15 family metallopeptidase [Lachnospiraceae bacterium]